MLPYASTGTTSTSSAAAASNEKTYRTLKIYNSLTRQKEVFRPKSGNIVQWYSCGPTVYDMAHIGHARTYLTFDIIRRCMQKFLGFSVEYMMNITDIDDKIINNARSHKLFNDFMAKNNVFKFTHNNINDNKNDNQSDCVNIFDNARIGDEIRDGLKLMEEKREDLISENDGNDADAQGKVKMYDNMIKKTNLALEKLNIISKNNNSDSNNDKAKLLSEISNNAKEAIMQSLDSKYAHSINDNQVFIDYAKKYEDLFFQDCDNLNILRPSIVTRVTDYCIEIVRYIQQIIDSGFAYVSNGSVYFDIAAFQNSPIGSRKNIEPSISSTSEDIKKHVYAKLMPEMRKNNKETNNKQNQRNESKKNDEDFVLWKSHLPGQPSWPSPWGAGRPGWHIECSAMCHSVFGSNLDLHSGGIDLKFPHHDNEIAQCEAHSNSDDWCSFWLHSGHLNIQGLKMSKSLKNFITIRDALHVNDAIGGSVTKENCNNKANTLRMLMMLHSWNSTLDYSEKSLEESNLVLMKFKNFLNNIESLRSNPTLKRFSQLPKYEYEDFLLLKKLSYTREEFYDCICDNFNMKGAIESLMKLMSSTWTYMDQNRVLNEHLLFMIGDYIEQTMMELGFFPLIQRINCAALVSNASVTSATNAMVAFSEESTDRSVTNPVQLMKVLADFRENVKKVSIKSKNFEALKECDRLRDEILPKIGYKLSDTKRGPTISILDSDEIKKANEK